MLRQSAAATPRRTRFILATLISALLPAVAPATDAIKTWTGLVNNSVNAVGNWDNNLRPTFTGNTDALVFDGAGSGTVNIAVDVTAKSVTTNNLGYLFNGIGKLTLGDATTGTVVPNTGNLTNSGGGTVNLNNTGGVFLNFGTINAAGGAITFSAANLLNIGNDLTGAVNNVVIDGANNVTVNALIAGAGTDTSAGGELIKNGAGTLFLNGDSAAWNGRITINEGAVRINKANSLGSSAGRTTISGGAATGRLELVSGISVAETFYLGGRTASSAHIVNVSAGNSVVGALKLQAGGTEYRLESTTGTLTASGDVTYDTASGATNLTLAGAGNGIVSGNVGAGGAAISIIKEGNGTWTLNGANSYTGSTTVNAGRLNITAAQTGGGAISLGDGATLGLKLTAGGQSLVASALTLGSTTGGTLAFDLGSFGNPTVPVIAATSLAINGTNTLTVTGGGFSVGKFTLLSYTGTIGGSTGIAGLSLGTLPARVTAILVDDVENTRVQLNITAFDVPKWTGAADANWDIDDGTGTGTLNWREVNSGNDTRYLQGANGIDRVVFDDTANPLFTSINLTAPLTPGGVTVNNSTLNYTFIGAGSLGGTGNLLKQGTGTLVLASTGVGTRSGTTTIDAGTLQIGDGVNPGTGAIGTGEITNHGTLIFNRPDALAVPANITGDGVIEKRGSGGLTLSGNNTFTGTLTIGAGTVVLGTSTALGSIAGGTIVEEGGTLDVRGKLLPAGEVVTIRGSGVLGTGAVINSGGGNGAGVGLKNLVLAAPATIGGSARWDIRDNNGAVNANGFTLTKVGTANLFWANLGETHLGNVLIQEGRLAFEGNTTLGDQPGTVQIGAGASIGFEDSTVPHTKVIELNGGTIVASAGTANRLDGEIQLDGDGTVQTAGNTTLTINGVIGGTGNFRKTTGGTLILTGDNTYLGVTTITQGVLRIGEDGTTGSLGVGDFSFEAATGQNATLQIRRSDTALVVANNIVSPGAGANTIVVGVNNGASNNAVVTFSGNNTFSGAVTINGGALRITNSSALGIGPKTVSIASAGRPSLRLDGSVGDILLDPSISFTTNNDNTTSPAIVNEAGANTIGGAIALANGGGGQTRVRAQAGTLTLAGGIAPATNATSTRTLFLDGAASGIIDGVVASGSQTLVLTKDGAGTWTLNAANTYTGNTNILAGTLKLGASGSIASSPTVNVSAAATFDVSSVTGFALAANQTLTGAGSIVGSVTDNANSLISPGSATAVGTLSFGGNLNFAGGGRTLFNLGSPTANDLVSVAGNLSLAGTTTVQIEPLGAQLTGSYRLIDYAGTLTGDATNLTASHSTRYTYNFDTSTPQQVNVNVSGAAANLVWSGDGGANIWDLNTSANWNAGAEKFFNSDSVTFDDSTGNTSITLAVALFPNKVTINGAADYTFVGTGSFNGAPGGLVKNGSGILRLITANTYSGPTEINGGTVIVSGSIAGSAVRVNSGGTLGGTGTINTNNQPLTLALGGKLSPGVNEGTLTVNTGTASLDLSAAVTDFASAALVFQLAAPTASDRITLSGGSLQIGTGVLAFDDFAFTTLDGFVSGTYPLFTTNTSILGSLDADFAHLTGSLGNGYTGTLAISADGTDLELIVVPEPTALHALVAGAVLVLGLRRRREPAKN